ncbi:MAG: hypothetical protein OHK93_000757 [Ramalina farinacea]|uniref:Methyltransferase type 11 domain-containing protein n=1 Tax=Ramalina farinacea TaxID=258253 RepID=A0AA43QSG7_9LECA|nr:hypothetical protein [Ramalina farinacea]
MASSDMKNDDVLAKEMNRWSGHANAYTNVERLTLPLAIQLAQWVDSVLPFATHGASALDDGCGSGVLGSAIKTVCPAVPLLSCDVAEGMLSQAQSRAKKEQWSAPCDFQILDARNLEGVPDASITHLMSQYMICLAPEPDRIAQEMYRVLKPGGVLGLGTYGLPRFDHVYYPWVIAAWKIGVLDFEILDLMASKWTKPASVKDALEEAGFKDVEVREKMVDWEFESLAKAMHYAFREGNPAMEAYKQAWREKSGKDTDVFEPVYAEEMGKLYEQEDGRVVIPIKVVFCIGRK